LPELSGRPNARRSWNDHSEPEWGCGRILLEDDGPCHPARAEGVGAGDGSVGAVGRCARSPG
jgi:hypothetical protein